MNASRPHRLAAHKQSRSVWESGGHRRRAVDTGRGVGVAGAASSRMAARAGSAPLEGDGAAVTAASCAWATAASGGPGRSGCGRGVDGVGAAVRATVTGPGVALGAVDAPRAGPAGGDVVAPGVDVVVAVAPDCTGAEAGGSSDPKTVSGEIRAPPDLPSCSAARTNRCVAAGQTSLWSWAITGAPSRVICTASETHQRSSKQAPGGTCITFASKTTWGGASSCSGFTVAEGVGVTVTVAVAVAVCVAVAGGAQTSLNATTGGSVPEEKLPAPQAHLPSRRR